LAKDNALTVGKVYATGSQWIVRATAEAPRLNFDRTFAYEIGVASALNMGVGLCNFVVGFGLVKWKTEQPNPKSPYSNNNLIFIMNHTDFNPSVSTFTWLTHCMLILKRKTNFWFSLKG
jgi:hypothetical protein